MAKALGQKDLIGALVAEVAEDTPASKAGFKVQDIIISYEGKKVDDHDDLPLMVASTVVGSTVPVEVLRGGKKIKLYATITELKAATPVKIVEKDEATQEFDRIGVISQNLDPALAKKIKLEITDGVLITKVKPGSAAQLCGLAKGDILMGLNHKRIMNTETLDRVVKSLPKDTPILVLIRKKEGRRFSTLKIDK